MHLDCRFPVRVLSECEGLWTLMIDEVYSRSEQKFFEKGSTL